MKSVLERVFKRITNRQGLFLVALFLNLFAIHGVMAYENKCCAPKGKETFHILSTMNLKENSSDFSMGDYLVIRVDSIDSLDAANLGSGLYLWINGIYFQDLQLEQMDLSCNKLYFRLERKDTSAASPWNIFYSYRYYFLLSKKATVSVGTNTKVISDCREIVLKTTGPWMCGIGYLVMVLILSFVFFISNKILRGAPPFAKSQNVVVVNTKKPGNAELGENEIYFFDLPFSLSRFQLMFWTVIVVISIVYVWIYTDELVSPSTTVLLLLGISGGTNLVGKVIDNNKSQQQANAATDQLTVKQFFERDYESKGFLTDIISDENGISVHRFQLVIFTCVLGIYFVWQVICNLAMPDFSTTLLLLMGISNTTYAGLKMTE